MCPVMEMCVRVFLVIVIISTEISRTAASAYPCVPCKGAECEELAEFCPYGESRDSCNRRVCAKGPGGRCGGPNNILGDCGEGLRCKSDERCHGCYISTIECWTEHPPIQRTVGEAN